jgi:hypothetical protein
MQETSFTIFLDAREYPRSIFPSFRKCLANSAGISLLAHKCNPSRINAIENVIERNFGLWMAILTGFDKLRARTTSLTEQE